VSVLLAFVVFQTRFNVEAERAQLKGGVSPYAASVRIKNDGVFPVLGLRIHCEADLISATVAPNAFIGFLNSGGTALRVCNFGTSQAFRENFSFGRAARVTITYRPVFVFLKIPERYEVCREFWFAAQPAGHRTNPP
jgi:hypothetical protein